MSVHMRMSGEEGRRLGVVRTLHIHSTRTDILQQKGEQGGENEEGELLARKVKTPQMASERPPWQSWHSRDSVLGILEIEDAKACCWTEFLSHFRQVVG
jgi:hypothetical protein